MKHTLDGSSERRPPQEEENDDDDDTEHFPDLSNNISSDSLLSKINLVSVSVYNYKNKFRFFIVLFRL